MLDKETKKTIFGDVLDASITKTWYLGKIKHSLDFYGIITHELSKIWKKPHKLI